MSRPVWLLDVDGVVNVARPGWGAAPRSGNAYSGATAYRMRWAPTLIERIRLRRAGTRTGRQCGRNKRTDKPFTARDRRSCHGGDNRRTTSWASSFPTAGSHRCPTRSARHLSAQ
jgi:hypothetical protein